MTAEEDDPEVQRNGFEVIIEEALDSKPEAFDDFFDDWFNPNDTWDENLDRFFEYGRKVKGFIDGKDDKEEILEELG